MKKEVMQKWVKALRSGKYKQGYSYLKKQKVDWEDRTYYEHCCLGVLCELAKDDLNISWEPKSKGDLGILKIGKTKKGEALLPPSVQKWAGMKTKEGKFQTVEGEESLIDLNDSGNSFKAIANLIQMNWKKL